MPARNEGFEIENRFRDLLHDGLASARSRAPEDLARQISRFDRWLHAQEKSSDRRRRQLVHRLENASDDARERVAGAIRSLERRVRPV